MILLITLHTNDIHDIIDKHKIMWGQISLQVSKVHIFLNTQLNLYISSKKCSKGKAFCSRNGNCKAKITHQTKIPVYVALLFVSFKEEL